MDIIPFNRPFMTDKELEYIKLAHSSKHLSGDGQFTHKCQKWLEETTGCKKALLTHSCTGALEMSAILTDIKPGDEVIMPSFTFVSTANAFVLRGAKIVFVDIRSDTLNMDETKIEAAITEKTKAIVPVHYAGVACDMDPIMEIANRHNLFVIEDAAQGIMATYKNRPLGSIGHLGTLSFHETKNIICGEGGALLINDSSFTERAEIIREKGTNRSKFFRGEVDKYSWIDIGSSYLPSELVAAFLFAQIEQCSTIVEQRMKAWAQYHEAFLPLSQKFPIRCPVIPSECQHNGHIYYLLLPSLEQRNTFIKCLKEMGIHTVFHYVPLDSAPAGKKYARISGSLEITHSISDCLLRLPLWIGVEEHLELIIAKITGEIKKLEAV